MIASSGRRDDYYPHPRSPEQITTDALVGESSIAYLVINGRNSPAQHAELY
ncbi:MAG: hypothetical protein KKG00_02500 [Bacteroidetes bacterium]|nr:hypothetical protein [Bacteroidota bacterium]